MWIPLVVNLKKDKDIWRGPVYDARGNGVMSSVLDLGDRRPQYELAIV